MKGKKFNTEKYNKLCAEFMGLVEAKPYKTAYTTDNSTHLRPSFLELVHSEMESPSWYVYPKFDSDWNWIMEVIKKIGDNKTFLPLPMGGIQDSIVPYLNEVRPITQELVYANKEGVVQAIWEFLNWYNKQKQ